MKRLGTTFIIRAIAITGLCVLFCTSCVASKEDVTIVLNDMTIMLLQNERGSQKLIDYDDYYEGFSEFDYMSRFNTTEMPNAQIISNFYLDNVLSWNEDELERIRNIASKVDKKIEAYNLELPDVIYIVKSNNRIEAGASHVRGTTMVYSEDFINSTSDREFESVFIHELFHIYTEHNPQYIEELYEIIHFYKSEEVIYPPEISDLKITNPGLKNNYYINCLYDGQEYRFITILYASQAYDKTKGFPFFAYMKIGMLAVELHDGTPFPVYRNDEPLIVEQKFLENYMDLVGRNTFYTIHPEEILADNFALMVLQEKVMSPEILEEMKQFFDDRQ